MGLVFLKVYDRAKGEFETHTNLTWDDAEKRVPDLQARGVDAIIMPMEAYRRFHHHQGT